MPRLPLKTDPDDKHRTLRRLDAAWRLNRGMRLGQLIYNAIQQNDDDLFYISDAELCERLVDLCDYRDILEGIADSASVIISGMNPADPDPIYAKLRERVDAWRNAK